MAQAGPAGSALAGAGGEAEADRASTPGRLWRSHPERAGGPRPRHGPVGGGSHASDGGLARSDAMASDRTPVPALAGLFMVRSGGAPGRHCGAPPPATLRHRPHRPGPAVRTSSAQRRPMPAARTSTSGQAAASALTRRLRRPQ
jgi:hypothetical protein